MRPYEFIGGIAEIRAGGWTLTVRVDWASEEAGECGGYITRPPSQCGHKIRFKPDQVLSFERGLKDATPTPD